MQDLIIVGGGIMGLMTAWYASERAASVMVVERGAVGDPMTASYGRTRSIRSDYLDATYALLAQEALQLWKELETRAAQRMLVGCGCLNLAKRSVTEDLEQTYALRSYAVLERLALPRAALDRALLEERFPQFKADVGRLDAGGGLLDVEVVTRTMLELLASRGVRIAQNTEVTEIRESADHVVVVAAGSTFEARAVVLTAGHGVNGILANSGVQFPISRDRPTECKYFAPIAEKRHLFTEKVFPVFAYLDIGIYGHPIVEGRTEAVKIGYYNPPDVKTSHERIGGVEAFVREFIPDLEGAAVEDVKDADGCDYDLVSDDDFILGPAPGRARTFVGTGWRGTGYKYAPWIGRTLAQLAVQGSTVYDIRRFAPARFFAEVSK